MSWGPLSPWDDGEEPEPPGATPAEVLKLLDLQTDLLRSVATGGPRIDSVNHRYLRRRSVLNAGLKQYGIDPPFPWHDLWGWHGKWKEVSGTYAGRRRYISDLAAPARDRLEQLIAGVAVADPGPATPDWPDLESRLHGLHAELREAESIDDLQDVGRRSREIIIDLANLVYRPGMLPTPEPEQPTVGDAKTRLAYAAAALMSGHSHEHWRKLIRAAWDLANAITHSSSVNRVDAFAAVQAVVLLVRTFEQASSMPTAGSDSHQHSPRSASG